MVGILGIFFFIPQTRVEPAQPEFLKPEFEKKILELSRLNTNFFFQKYGSRIILSPLPRAHSHYLIPIILSMISSVCGYIYILQHMYIYIHIHT